MRLNPPVVTPEVPAEPAPAPALRDRNLSRASSGGFESGGASGAAGSVRSQWAPREAVSERPVSRLARRQPSPDARPPAPDAPRRPAPLNAYSAKRCDDFFAKSDIDRERLFDNVISRVVLDITPTKPAQLRDPAEGMTRTWRDRSGKVLAVGKLVDFKQGRVSIERKDGTVTEVAFYRLSNADMCYVNAIWQVPLEFVLSDEVMKERQWRPMTLTWKASELCNKPLYFEEAQLERYGHTFNPYFQPVVSGAHFFLNIAVLPYKMGIHPIHECRYDLGYYRPGSCAPWMVPPVPLSVRGGLIEAGVILGGVYALP